MNQYEKSVATLELPAVLEQLAQEAVSAGAKEKARSLSPCADAAEVGKRLAETSAAKNMMVVKGSPSFSGVKDVRASLSRADRGGMLNIRELLDIAAVLSASRQARSYGAGNGREEKSCIDYLFSSLQSNRQPGAGLHPAADQSRIGPGARGASENHILAVLRQSPSGPHHHHALGAVCGTG